MANKALLLEHTQILPIIRRMALQIIESNLGEAHIILAGIKDRGTDIARMLAEEIRKLSRIEVVLTEIKINKSNPLDVSIQADFDFNGKAIIVVDDVADSGKTMVYAIKPLLQFNLKKLEVAVLIDREHKLFPITSTYVGYEISTTVKDKIRVEVEKEKITAYIC